MPFANTGACLRLARSDRGQSAPKEIPLGCAPQEAPLGCAPQEIPLGYDRRKCKAPGGIKPVDHLSRPSFLKRPPFGGIFRGSPERFRPKPARPCAPALFTAAARPKPGIGATIGTLVPVSVDCRRLELLGRTTASGRLWPVGYQAILAQTRPCWYWMRRRR